MMNMNAEKELRRLTMPRAASISNILFSVLFVTSLVLIRTSIPDNLAMDINWVEQGTRRIIVALELMPFAGIAFLWFIGVVRDRLGVYEDQFFSTVFLGSGLLFLAMIFVSMAIFSGILAVAQFDAGGDTPGSDYLLRAGGNVPDQQCLCITNGGCFYDFARNDLAAHWFNASLAGSGFLCPCACTVAGHQS